MRQFSQDDAHCFVTQDQIGKEVAHLIGLVKRVYADFNLDCTAKLSTRPTEFLGEIPTWDSAESQLKAALDEDWPNPLLEKLESAGHLGGVIPVHGRGFWIGPGRRKGACN